MLKKFLSIYLFIFLPFNISYLNAANPNSNGHNAIKKIKITKNGSIRLKFCKPISEATSISPPIPIVEFIATLPKSFANKSNLPWNKLFTDESMSCKFEKKLGTAVSIGWGTIAL